MTEDEARFQRLRSVLPEESTVDLDEVAAAVAAVSARAQAQRQPSEENHVLYTLRLLRASTNGGRRIRPVG